MSDKDYNLPECITGFEKIKGILFYHVKYQN